MEPLHFCYTNRKPLMRAFQWYPGGGLGPILEPAIKHRPDVTFWSGVAAGVAQVQYWSLHSQPRQGGR